MGTINTSTIRARMNSSGSHWWDAASMRFFDTVVIDKTARCIGPCLYAFRTQETAPSGAMRISIRVYNQRENDIETVGEFHSMTREESLSMLGQLERAAPLTLAQADAMARGAEGDEVQS